MKAGIRWFVVAALVAVVVVPPVARADDSKRACEAESANLLRLRGLADVHECKLSVKDGYDLDAPIRLGLDTGGGDVFFTYNPAFFAINPNPLLGDVALGRTPGVVTGEDGFEQVYVSNDPIIAVHVDESTQDGVRQFVVVRDERPGSPIRLGADTGSTDRCFLSPPSVARNGSIVYFDGVPVYAGPYYVSNDPAAIEFLLTVGDPSYPYGFTPFSSEVECP